MCKRRRRKKRYTLLLLHGTMETDVAFVWIGLIEWTFSIYARAQPYLFVGFQFKWRRACVCVCWITNEKPTIAMHCVSFESTMAATFILVYCHNASLFAAPFTQHAANAANQTVFNILVWGFSLPLASFACLSSEMHWIALFMVKWHE